MWLLISKITCCTIVFQSNRTKTRQNKEVHMESEEGKYEQQTENAVNKNNKQKYSPPMSKYVRNIRLNSSVPSFFNSFFNLQTMPFVGTMTLLDSMPSLSPHPMPSNRSNSFVKCLSVSPTITFLSDSRLKVVAMGQLKSDFKRYKASKYGVSNSFCILLTPRQTTTCPRAYTYKTAYFRLPSTKKRPIQ